MARKNYIGRSFQEVSHATDTLPGTVVQVSRKKVYWHYHHAGLPFNDGFNFEKTSNVADAAHIPIGHECDDRCDEI